jgi:hypothetical protein
MLLDWCGVVPRPGICGVAVIKPDIFHASAEGFFVVFPFHRGQHPNSSCWSTMEEYKRADGLVIFPDLSQMPFIQSKEFLSTTFFFLVLRIEHR